MHYQVKAAAVDVLTMLWLGLYDRTNRATKIHRAERSERPKGADSVVA